MLVPTRVTTSDLHFTLFTSEQKVRMMLALDFQSQLKCYSESKFESWLKFRPAVFAFPFSLGLGHTRRLCMKKKSVKAIDKVYIDGKYHYRVLDSELLLLLLTLSLYRLIKWIGLLSSFDALCQWHTRNRCGTCPNFCLTLARTLSLYWFPHSSSVMLLDLLVWSDQVFTKIKGSIFMVHLCIMYLWNEWKVFL